MMKVGEGKGDGNVLVFVTIDGSCTSCDGCNNHAARKIEKKVIIRRRFLCFLLVVTSSEGFDLALQVNFFCWRCTSHSLICRT